MRYVSKHRGQNFIFFVFLYFTMLCAKFQNIVGNIYFFFFIFLKLRNWNFACYVLKPHSIAKQRVIKRYNFLFFHILLCYVLCFKTKRLIFVLLFLYFAMLCYVSKQSDKNFIFFGFLYFAMLCYVSKHSGQNFIFFVFLYFAMLCYVSKHSGQNLFFFVFLYFAMLCAMFQNIAGNIFFFIFLKLRNWNFACYVLKHST